MNDRAGSNPSISIIVPCYNQAEFLPECLASIKSQTLQQWECIVVDDGSTDNTCEITETISKEDQRFRLLQKKNGGVASARNAGIAIAQSDFILPLDADDTLHPEFLKTAIPIMLADKKIRLVYSAANFFGERRRHVELQPYDYGDFLSNNMIFCTAIFRKSDFTNVNGYDTNMVWGLEDWEFYFRLLSPEAIVHFINQPLFNYRIKKLSRSTELTAKRQQQMLQYAYRKHQKKISAYLPRTSRKQLHRIVYNIVYSNLTLYFFSSLIRSIIRQPLDWTTYKVILSAKKAQINTLFHLTSHSRCNPS